MGCLRGLGGSGRGVSIVDEQVRAVYEAGVLASQEQCCRRYFSRSAQAALHALQSGVGNLG